MQDGVVQAVHHALQGESQLILFGTQANLDIKIASGNFFGAIGIRPEIVRHDVHGFGQLADLVPTFDDNPVRQVAIGNILDSER